MSKKEKRVVKKKIEKEITNNKFEYEVGETKQEKKRKKTIIIVSILVGLLILVGGFLAFLKYSSNFKYDKYDKKVVVQYNGKKSSSMPDICFGNILKCTKVKAKQVGKVDTSKVGSYKIKYVYKYKDKELVLDRTVEVKDLKEPEIVLNDEEVKVCPNGKILKLDVSANDDYDGDITEKIESIYENKKVKISVKDSFGNEGKKEIDVDPKDEEGPVITLNGLKSTSLVVGLNYTDAGAKAEDNCDGEVKVETSGSVDINNIGDYTLTYTATDSSGNKSTAERKVTIKNRVVGNKVIYLTFDDGPGGHTQQLLDILDKYNVKATFFVTNQFPGYQHLIGEEAKRGHTVAVHTLTHKWNIYDSVDAYLADFNAMNDIIEQQTGSRTKIFRFPGGSSNHVYCGHNKTAIPDIVSKMNELGNVYYDWNVSSGDAGGTTNSDQVYRNVINNLKADNSVVLQHDIKGFSVNAVPKIIEYGLNNGYTFKALTVDSPVTHHGIYTCK